MIVKIYDGNCSIRKYSRKIRFSFKRKLLLIAFAGSIATGANAEKLIRKWKFNSKSDLRPIHFTFANDRRNLFLWRCSEDIKTPDNENSLELDIEARRPEAGSHSKQVNFFTVHALKRVAKYRISFWCKASSDGEIEIIAAQAGSPYKKLGENAEKTIKVGKQWQKITLDFEALKDSKERIAVPRLKLGLYPRGSIVYLGPVRFSEITSLK